MGIEHVCHLGATAIKKQIFFIRYCRFFFFFFKLSSMFSSFKSHFLTWYLFRMLSHSLFVKIILIFRKAVSGRRTYTSETELDPELI